MKLNEEKRNNNQSGRVLVGRNFHLYSCQKSLSPACETEQSVEERKLLQGGVSALLMGCSEQHKMLVLIALAGIQIKTPRTKPLASLPKSLA